MRALWRRQHEQRMFRGAEVPRLMTAIIMLAVIYMLIVWARDANTWRWLASGNRKASVPAQSDISRRPKPLPAATGPTDEDSEQAEAVREEFQAITDGTLTLDVLEMEAYDRLVEWAKNQPLKRLYERAHKDLRYSDLYDNAERRRGELVALDLVVCDVMDVQKNRFGVPLHEARGITVESRGRLYVLIVVDYPKTMPVGFNIREKVTFAGYFLKLQGYQSAIAKPGDPPEKAPLLIGRLQWDAPPTVANTDDTTQWIWGLGVLAMIALVFGGRTIYYKLKGRNSTSRRMIPKPKAGEVIPIEEWLEQSSFGEEDRTDQ